MNIDDMKFLFKEQLMDDEFCYILHNPRTGLSTVETFKGPLEDLILFFSVMTPGGFDDATNFPILILE